MHNKRLLSRREALVKGRLELGQVQILAIFLFLLLIPTTMIIAQNATVNTSSEITEMILNVTDEAEATENITIEENETLPENITQEINQTESNVTEPQNETIEIPPSNQTNETEPIENVTLPELNQTANETIINETIINQTLINETEVNETGINETEINETLPEPPEVNETVNETEEEPEILTPVIEVGIISPDKATRGESFELSAYARNNGSASANVFVEWVLPEDFVILSGSGSVNCQEVAPQTSCWNNITATVSLSSNLGLNYIKVKVSYSE